MIFGASEPSSVGWVLCTHALLLGNRCLWACILEKLERKDARLERKDAWVQSTHPTRLANTLFVV